MWRKTGGSIGQKFDLADQIIGDRYGYKRPAGGFFLWLDVAARRQRSRDGNAVARGRRAGAARTLSRARAGRRHNPGADYIRVAMVQNKETTAEALHRLVAVLG